MKDEELIAAMRDLSAGPSSYLQDVGNAAADRIKALVNEAVLSKAAYEGVSSLLLSVQQDCIKERQRAERLEAAIRELQHRWYLGDLQQKDFTAALKGDDHE